MIKTLLISAFLLLGSSGIQETKSNSELQSSVYICNSSGAKRYHLVMNCRGLNACSHKVVSVSLTDAKSKYKRTLCKWED